MQYQSIWNIFTKNVFANNINSLNVLKVIILLVVLDQLLRCTVTVFGKTTESNHTHKIKSLYYFIMFAFHETYIWLDLFEYHLKSMTLMHPSFLLDIKASMFPYNGGVLVLQMKDG